MVTRIGGLASGMDIDALVEKLMKAERSPLNKLQQKKTTYEWQRDAYRNVNTKLKTFDTYVADNLVLKSMNSKTATSSNSSLVSATATSAATGTITIEGVSQLAKSARGVGNQVNANGTTKLSDLMTQNGITLPAEIKLSSIKSDGTMSDDVSIALDENMTINQFVAKVNSSNAGVSTIFESGKLSITAKNTGDNKNGAEIKVSSGGQVFNALGFTNITGDSGDLANDGSNAVFQVNGIATERTTNSFSINGYNITLNSAFNADKTTAVRYNSALLEWKNTHDTAFNTLLTNAKTRKDTAEAAHLAAETGQTNAKVGLMGNLTPDDYTNFNKINNLGFVESALKNNYLSTYENQYSTYTSDEYNSMLNNSVLSPDQQLLKDNNISYEQFRSIFSLSQKDDKDEKVEEIESKLKNLTKSSYFNTLGDDFLNGLTDNEKSLLQGIQSKSLTISDLDAAINDWANSVNADPTLNAAEKGLATKLSGLSSAQKSALKNVLSDVDAINPTATNALQPYLTLAAANKTVTEATTEKNSAQAAHQQLVDRQEKAEEDFKAAYKAQTGKELTEGVNIEGLNEVTVPTNSSAAITLSSTSNVDDMLNKVKDFVNTYNGLIKDLLDKTKESKYRDYLPLTSDQRKDMDEDEIKLWEEKAKSGLLRNDSIIRNGLSNLRSLIYQSNPAIDDARYNTLYSIGITTTRNYNDGGTLEIDETKLRKAIEENPDAVEKLFKNIEGKKDDVVNGEKVDTRGYLTKLRESIKTIEVNIEKKAGRSTMTDVQYTLGQSIRDANKRIDTWEDKLKSLEQRYWKQFTAMESAINKANQQSSLFMQG